MNAETLSYCERLKQRAEVSAVIRLAACFLEMWEDNEGDGIDVDRCTDYLPLLCIRGHHADVAQ